MTRNKFFRKLIETNQQELWLAEYNIEVARDIVRESIRRLPYLIKETEKWEKKKKKIGSEDAKVAVGKRYYEKLKTAKDYLKGLKKEVDLEESNIKSARAQIIAYKNKAKTATKIIVFQVKYLQTGGFNLDDEVDKDSKVDNTNNIRK